MPGRNQQHALIRDTWVLWMLLILCLIAMGPRGVNAETRNRDDLFSICFSDEIFGWACGRWGTVLHSADGGKTWKEQHSGVSYTLGGIYFIDRQNGWAVGNMGTIIHTSDGGKTWQQQESPVPYYLMDVYFVSKEKGWIVTEQTHILYTEDGGKTWEVQFQDQDYILKSISFSDHMHGWAVGEFGHIYRTMDGGRTWEKLAGGAIINDIGDLEGGPYLFDVVAIDEKTAWVVGIEGRVMMTQDAGKTWADVQTGSPPTQLFSIAFNQKDTLVIGGKGICIISENSGVTWQKADFDTQIEYTWIYAVAAVGASSFMACGEEGGIYMGHEGHFQKAR